MRIIPDEHHESQDMRNECVVFVVMLLLLLICVAGLVTFSILRDDASAQRAGLVTQ